MGDRGKAVMANEVRPCGVPRRRFGYFAAAGKVTRRPQTAESPCEKESDFPSPPHPAPSGPPSPQVEG